MREGGREKGGTGKEWREQKGVHFKSLVFWFSASREISKNKQTNKQMASFRLTIYQPFSLFLIFNFLKHLFLPVCCGRQSNKIIQQGVTCLELYANKRISFC